MCYNSYRLYRANTKLISPFYRQKLLTGFRCGHCPECLEQSRKEWYARSIYEFQDTLASNGYMLFDCLTYRDRDIPRLSHYFHLDKSLDGYCFDYSHMKLFLNKLRSRLSRAGYDSKTNLRYFYATEYGDHGTHRSHIHILFFVRNSFIDPIDLSRYISDCWQFGRTDGFPYKSVAYVKNHNVIGNNKGSSARVCSYVSKYVVKSLRFSDKLEKWTNRILFSLFSSRVRDVAFDFVRDFDNDNRIVSCSWIQDYDSFNDFVASPLGQRIKRAIKSRIDMFHRQSLGYGWSAVANRSIDDIIANPRLQVYDSNKIVINLYLPSYYRRKLFQVKFTFNGVQYWSLTDDGKRFRNKQLSDNFDKTIVRLNIDKLNYNLDFDSAELARYLVFNRGVFKGSLSCPVSLSDVVNSSNLIFNYSSIADFEHYKMRFVSSNFLGHKSIGFKSADDVIPIDVFVCENVYLDVRLEALLAKIDCCKLEFRTKQLQKLRLTERLTDLYKSVLIN